MGEFFIFPSGIFEDENTDKYSVYKQRNIPCTPQGDLVAGGKSKVDCLKIISDLNIKGSSLEDAINFVEDN